MNPNCISYVNPAYAVFEYLVDNCRLSPDSLYISLENRHADFTDNVIALHEINGYTRRRLPHYQSNLLSPELTDSCSNGMESTLCNTLFNMRKDGGI